MRVVAVTFMLSMAVMLIPQHGLTTQSSSLRHRSLQISGQPVSSQHQSSYQSKMGQLTQPQTSTMKSRQDLPSYSSMGLPQQLQPQASLWHSHGGSGGSTTQSSAGQQNPQQQTPQQNSFFQSKNTDITGQKQVGNMQQPALTANQNLQLSQQHSASSTGKYVQSQSGDTMQQIPHIQMNQQVTNMQNTQNLFQAQYQAPQEGSRMQYGTINNVGGGNNQQPVRQPGSQETILQQPSQQQSQLQVSSALQVVQNPQQQQVQQRSSKKEAQLGVSVPDQNPDCEVPNASEVSVASPAWTASYPGSGAKLTWKLIRAITGIFTSDDHDHNGRVAKGMVVAVKTHFPSHTPLEIFDKENLKGIGRAILLTRNPINSIPSYHNFVYEVQNGLLNHSTRAPIEAWIKWRNALFEQELLAWIDHQKYWLDNYPRDKLHLVSMEHLTSNDRGPTTIQHLGQFLAAGSQDIAESMVPYDRMPCIWDMFVHGKVPGERERRHSHRSGGPKTYPFTQLQLEQMIAALAQFKNDYGGQHPDLAFILDEYIVTIQEHKGKIEQL